MRCGEVPELLRPAAVVDLSRTGLQGELSGKHENRVFEVRRRLQCG